MAAKSILVCLKWVSTRTEVHPITGDVTTDDRFSGISPADSSALEWGLMLGTALGASVTVATVGPKAAEKVLIEAIACGAGKAVRVAADAEISSELTAAALSAIGQDHLVVVCGDYSIDRGSGSVPAFMAHRLGLPQALGLLHLETERGQVVATRRLDQGRRERLALRLPAVISVESGLELRRAALSATLSATSAMIEIRDLTEFANLAKTPERTHVGPYRPRARVISAPNGDAAQRVLELAQIGGQPSAAKVITESPEESARIAVEHLREWGYL
jgi:electron transfer flavoprotein beta subunit